MQGKWVAIEVGTELARKAHKAGTTPEHMTRRQMSAVLNKQLQANGYGKATADHFRTCEETVSEVFGNLQREGR